MTPDSFVLSGHAAGIRPAVPTALLMPDRTLTSLRSFATRYARTRYARTRYARTRYARTRYARTRYARTR